jgi:hypothetical protein
MSAGWMNEFVEVVIGSSIVIPIAAGYLGLDWILNNAGFAMAFQTMPFLFGKWGAILGTMGGVFWFGLLFFAGITSSLAMCTPYISFMMDEFRFSRKKAAYSVGAIVFLVGLPAVLFFNQGVFDEYDYWTGTFSLFTFALLESILFAWVFGIDKGWEELTLGADIKLPTFYKPILKYITPTILLLIFVGSVFNPTDNDWARALKEGWTFDKSSIIGRIQNKSIEVNNTWFSDVKQSEVAGMVTKIGPVDEDHYYIKIGTFDFETGQIKELKRYEFHHTNKLLVSENSFVEVGTPLATGNFINNIFYIDISRIGLLIFFCFFFALVWIASYRRRK